jgi:hypothetical protein
MKRRTTVRLPEALIDRARRKAAAEGRTLTSLLEEGLRLGDKRSRPTKRMLPPISTATGGTLPGIDLTRTSDLDEFDDSLRVGRMTRVKYCQTSMSLSAPSAATWRNTRSAAAGLNG